LRTQSTQFSPHLLRLLLLLLLAWLHLLLLLQLLLLHVWLHHHAPLLLLRHLLLRLWRLHLLLDGPVLDHAAACCVVHACLRLRLLVLRGWLHRHHLRVLPSHAVLGHACSAAHNEHKRTKSIENTSSLRVVLWQTRTEG
jgi:hypothetical protein